VDSCRPGEPWAGNNRISSLVDPKKIDPAARVEALRAEAQELRVLASAARSQGVRTLLNIEAADREEQAEALENWLRAGQQNPG
jgi:hypothetical protein